MYLDHAATAPPRREVLEAMWPWLTQHFGNPASHHEYGEVAKIALDDARAKIAAQLGVHGAEIIFTSGGTEADNLAVKGIALADQERKHLIVSAIEHPAVLEAAHWLERFGYEVTELEVGQTGLISPESLAQALQPDTCLVSIQYANNEVGTIQPIAELAQVARQNSTWFHTDAVQAAGWLDLNVSNLGVDALAISGHKLGTPKGIGLLYLNRRLEFEPLIHGGGQQDGARSGTENVAGAVGLATALGLRAELGDQAARLSGLRDEFICQVEALGAELTGDRTARLPNNASFVFPGRSGESVLVDLAARGIVCSSGSACAAGSDEPSHVLTAMGFDRTLAQSAVRFTFDETFTEEALAEVVAALTLICG